MSWVIYFFGSGAAFFTGVAGVLAGVALPSYFRSSWAARAATLLGLVGLMLIVLSATPFPLWFYGAALTVSLFWLVVERMRRLLDQRYRIGLRILVLLTWLGATLVELPYHCAPTLQLVPQPTLYLFADSVSAGMGDANLETWPILLAQSHAVEVQDHSQMGAKVSTMVRKAEKLSLGKGLILLEIGGNDLLGTTTPDDFERDLERLLSLLCGAGRTVVMFELPLPPFGNSFGMAQRQLAAKYQVKLIPKRIFVGILTADNATIDGIHLTRTGHVLMAATVWDLLRAVFATEK